MTELSIRCDWEEDPGVADPAVAKTWAQIQIRVEGEPATRFLSLRSNSVRDAVYGSALPLAGWVVRNWWFLCHEGLRSLVALRGGRAAHGADATQRSWLRRHNLLTAREGYALPDLSLFRDEDRIHVCWAADPDDDFPRRGRFLGSGWRRISVEAARAGLREFVEAVLDRIEAITTEDAEDLRAMWSVVQEVEQGEGARRCEVAASLGVDLFSQEADALDLDVLAGLPEPVRRDLCDVTTRDKLAEDARAVAELLRVAPADGGQGPAVSSLLDRSERSLLAYAAGYARAKRVREHLRLGLRDPIPDLTGEVRRALGDFDERDVRSTASDARIDGVVGRSQGSWWLLGSRRSEAASRFRLGRALHQWLFSDERVRLLTRSQAGWEQRASRAFAAEFLAPAAGLVAELERVRGDGSIGRLARSFGVDDAVIALQIQNHNIELAA